MLGNVIPLQNAGRPCASGLGIELLGLMADSECNILLSLSLNLIARFPTLILNSLMKLFVDCKELHLSILTLHLMSPKSASHVCEKY